MLPKFGRGVCFWLISSPLSWVLRIKPVAKFMLGKFSCPALGIFFLTDLYYLLMEIRNRWLCLKCLMLWPDVVVHTCNLSIQKVKLGGLQSSGPAWTTWWLPTSNNFFSIYKAVKKNMKVTFPKVRNLCK